MSYLINKAGFTAHIYEQLSAEVMRDDGATDAMRLLQRLAGLVVETLLLFDDPDEGVAATYDKLVAMLGCEAYGGPLGLDALPPSYIIDYEIEQGRLLARDLFEEWLNCAHQFHDLLLFIIQNNIIRMENAGQPRGESLRLLMECVTLGLSYELAAQELCDIVIERKICRENWSLCDGVAALSAVAGRFLALSQNACERFSAPALPDKLDQVAYVMTQEAVRLGIPAGTDWRFGLAANDYPASAPYALICGLEPYCKELFQVMALHDLMDQSVACAKAAGRMLAVAAGGETPEIEPVIAKPLAMAAITETYRTICLGESAISGHI